MPLDVFASNKVSTRCNANEGPKQRENVSPPKALGAGRKPASVWHHDARRRSASTCEPPSHVPTPQHLDDSLNGMERNVATNIDVLSFLPPSFSSHCQKILRNNAGRCLNANVTGTKRDEGRKGRVGKTLEARSGDSKNVDPLITETAREGLNDG
uniref:Uncharacterized protein n=1 Tax=Vespula pensylvanica TaxID=30213 RepID=A0A834K8E6_VESPE|nr:hypothetical protein H0235_015349 [Vespula pensylvanica]